MNSGVIMRIIAIVALLIFIFGVIFTTLSSSLGSNGLGLGDLIGSRPSNQTYGIIKQDLDISEDFGDINTILTDSNELDPQGLSQQSVSLITQIDAQRLFILTQQEGIFRTNNGGETWQKIYILSDIEEETEGEKIARNNQVQVNDFWINREDIDIMYVAAKYNNLAKIYKTTDGAQSFEEIYSEVDPGSYVQKVVIDPNDSNHIYALLNRNTLIQTFDSGRSWQKLTNYVDLNLANDTAKQIGLIPTGTEEDNDRIGFFILFERSGLIMTPDGINWQAVPLNKAILNQNSQQANFSTNPVNQNIVPDFNNGFSGSFGNSTTFNNYTKLIFRTTPEGPIFFLIADNNLWQSPNLNSFTRMKKIPLQEDRINIADVNIDQRGVIWTAIKNTLWYSQNGGETWSRRQIKFPIGNISEIVIGRNNPNIMYLGLK